MSSISSELTPEERASEIKRATLRLAIIATVLAAIPTLIAMLVVPSGFLYIGSQYSSDDQMVYAAWMRQAMDMHFLFDNRFAVDPQPGITIHLYFFVLGLVCIPFKGLGASVAIPVVSSIARLVFTFLFIQLLGKLCTRLDIPVFVCKAGMTLACFGAGLGFTVWEAFGRLTKSANPIAGMLEQRLPIDVWQPEAFGFPSMLVNGLFMVSLCLIASVFLKVLEAKDSWRAVPYGAGAMFLLMNIHSYDVLIVLFTLIAFVLTLIASKQFDKQWAIRCGVIGLGAIPPALWYIHVIQSDPVFQARAATLTYTETFRQLIVGILPLFLLALPAFKQEKSGPIRWVGIGGLSVAIVVLFFVSTGYDPTKQYFMTMPAWGLVFCGFLAIVWFAAKESLAWNFFAAWGIVMLIIPYFPQLFQRKLSMGFAVPWGFLAAYGLYEALKLLKQAENQSVENFRRNRNLVAFMAVLICSASSIYWFQREILFVRSNVSSTTMQSIFMSSDVKQILAKVDEIPNRKVLIARPGIPGGTPEDLFAPPYLPDLNPLLSGFAGAYTYAGHWSETPDYNRRRGLAERVFQPRPPEEIVAILKETGATHLVQPIPEAFPDLPSGDLSQFGKTIYEGRQYRLIALDKSRL
ncbi:MAG: hypothetical protein KF836_10125 [Fimbriimonadaceae bacterium]|nr:hypothetical protein [Fimbriimonadaceae bacterium]